MADSTTSLKPAPCMKTRFKAIILIIIFLLTGSTNRQTKAQTFQQTDSLCRSVEKISLSQAKQAYKILDSLQSDSPARPDSLLLQSRVLLARAFADFAQGKSDTLLPAHARKLLASPQNTTFSTALLQLALACNHAGEAQYGPAFQSGLTALECLQALPEHEGKAYFIAKAYSVLGNICTLIKAYGLAEKYYSQEIELHERQSFEYYQCRLNLSKAHFYTQPMPATLRELEQLLPQLGKYGDAGLLSIAYLNIAACHIMQDQFDTAGTYYKTALDLAGEVDNNKLRFTLYQGLGSYYFYIQDIRQSFSYFNLSKQIAIKDQNLEQLSYVTYNIGLLYREMGKMDSALAYMMKHIDINNRLDRNSNAIETYQAYASALLEASENKLTIAQQKIELKNRSLILFIVSATGILLIGIMLFVFFWHQKRQQALIKDLEKRELENQLENEKRLKQLQAKRHQEKIDAKAREIASYALLVSNKNQVLQQIEDLAKKLPENLKETREINRLIKNNLNTEQAWEDFMLHFNKIHPRFFQRLKSAPHAKNLTENELRLCAYFRIGMSIKQIAQILNVSPESIRIHRYRLKKKLMLGEEENIDDFIRNV